VNNVFQWEGVTGDNATANERIGCLESCQSLHGSISSFAAATTGSIHPVAYGLFKATCGAAAASVPAPGTSDGGAMAAVLGELASGYKATALRYIGDMMLAWKALVVCGLFLPFMLSFVWIAALRFAAKPMVWMTVFLVDLSTLGVTLYCFSKAGAIGNNSFDGIVSYSDAGGFSFNHTKAAASAGAATTLPANSNSTSAGGIKDLGDISKRQMYYLVRFAFCVVLLLLLLLLLHACAHA
jgi:hypothetical protein